jgi:hypothetical protein
MVIGGAVVLAGSTVTLPTGSAPPACVDPLDANAIQDFWNAGVQLAPLTRQQWSTIAVSPPAIFWKLINPNGEWLLTGAGAALGPKWAQNLSLP